MGGTAMQTFSLKPGLAVEIQGRHMFYRARLLNRKLNFTDEIGEPLVMTEKEFFQGYASRSICVLPEQEKLGILPVQRTAPRDLSNFPEEHAREALRRRPYVAALEDYTGRLPSVTVLRDIIKKVWEQNLIGSCPAVSTVKRWRKRYRLNSVTSLVPRHENKGRQRLINGVLENILQDVLKELYLNMQRRSVACVVEEFQARVKEYNRQVLERDRLPVPAKNTVYRYVDSLDQYEVDAAREGKYAAKKKHRAAIGTLKVSSICERWEVDHTPVDVMLIDPDTGLTIGRPYLSWILDRYSRMVMAYSLHMAAPNTETVLRLVEKAICPKEKLLLGYPKVVNAWPAKGLPRQMVPDNGAEFLANDLADAFDELGSELLYPKSRGPEKKGGVERSFKTLALEFIHTIPGTTFSNTTQKGDYDSEAEACLTFDDLDQNLMRWIVDIYLRSPHSGLKKRTPDAVWREGEQSTVLAMPVDLDALEAILARRRQAVVHHYGVEVGGHVYHSEPLADMRLRRNSQNQVQVRYRDDLGHVWVYDDDRQCFLMVPAKDHRLSGVSRDLYDAGKKALKASGRLDHDADAVLLASREIQQDIQQARRSKKLIDRRRRAALKQNRGGQTVPLIVVNPTPAPLMSEFSADVIPELEIDDTELTHAEYV